MPCFKVHNDLVIAKGGQESWVWEAAPVKPCPVPQGSEIFTACHPSVRLD